jgi:metallo-beta-lactamase class B
VEKSNETNIKDAKFFITQGCERPWEVEIEPFKVAPHVYYVGNNWVSAYLVSTREGLILIDATMHNQVYLVFESVRKLGFNPKDIKLLLLSHAHYDHCGGVRPIIEYSGAKIYMGKEDELLLKARPDLLYTEGYAFGSFEPDEYYDDNSPIALGDMTIHTLHTPGHTPGTTSFFFEDKDEKGNIYRCGMHGGIGVNTLNDEYLEKSQLPISLRNDFLEGLLKLRDMKIDIALGSHPGQTYMLEKIGQISDTFNPFIDDTVWKKLMDERILTIKEIMENTRLQTSL